MRKVFLKILNLTSCRCQLLKYNFHQDIYFLFSLPTPLLTWRLTVAISLLGLLHCPYLAKSSIILFGTRPPWFQDLYLRCLHFRHLWLYLSLPPFFFAFYNLIIHFLFFSQTSAPRHLLIKKMQVILTANQKKKPLFELWLLTFSTSSQYKPNSIDLRPF